MPPFYWISNAIKTGDVGYDALGRKVARVIATENIDFGGSQRYLRIALILNVLRDRRTNLYQFGNQRLRVGDKLALTVGDVKFDGLVVRIGSETQEADINWGGETKKLTLRLYQRSVYSWLAQAYNSDFVVYDGEGREIFRILKSKILGSSNEITLNENRNQLVIKKAPHFKDVEMLVSLTAHCHQGICYYNRNQPIKVGLTLWTQSNTGIIDDAYITEIVDETPM